MSVKSPAEDLRMDVGALMGALWARLLRIIIITILLVVAAFVILLFVPKQYESSASLLVEDRSNIYTQASGPQGTTVGTNSTAAVSIDALISSQIELIKSRDLLLAVIDSQKLRTVPEFNGTSANPLTMVLGLIGKKPAPQSVDETVLQNLNDRLTVIRERDSAVITVFVRSADPQLAANIANAIAAEHVKRRAGQSVTDTQEAVAFLEQQIKDLTAKVKDDDTKVADYKAQNNIFAGSNGTTLPDQQLSDIGKQITDAQQAKNTAQEHANLIRSMLKTGQPVEGIEDVRNSTVVQSLMQNRATLQSTLAEKLATLLPGHPTIKALNAQIAQVNKQIASEADRIADGLDAQVKIQDGIIASLNDDLTRAKLAASTQTKDSVALDSLTREAAADRELLNSYLIKYRDASGRTDTGAVLPDVRVITQAAPSAVPASPKTALILGAVGFIALALQIGMVLFGELMSGRAVYDRTARPLETEPPMDVTDEVTEDEPDLFETAEPPPVAASIGDPEADLADQPEPDYPVSAAMSAITEAEPELVAQPRHHAAAAASLALNNLSADAALGRVRVILLAGISEARDAALAADYLVSDALHGGLSVCRVDAGSMRASTEPGLTDLCAEQASFGDVVHKVRDGLAEVPWGHLATLDRRSTRPLTLVEALADIYELVIVSTGRVGLNSSLPLFAGTRGRLVMVARSETPPALVEAVSADASSLGFDAVQSVLVPERQSEVA